MVYFKIARDGNRHWRCIYLKATPIINCYSLSVLVRSLLNLFSPGLDDVVGESSPDPGGSTDLLQYLKFMFLTPALLGQEKPLVGGLGCPELVLIGIRELT